ncbi:MAG TPA: hypothetical protein VJT71_10830 [Pyrinomonadaceae bacterium]|nr:hypothetical protein [Pyrinomonadaceae bacterium]
MKRLLFLILASALSAGLVHAQKSNTSGSAAVSSEAAVAKQGRQVNLQSNTQLAAQLENSLDASHARVGDRVALKTTQAVKQNREVIVPKGARLLGHVTEVQKRTKSNGESRIGVVFDRLQKGSLDVPITATITSITQSKSQARAGDSSVDSDLMTSSSARSSSGTSSSNQRGGLLSGVGNTVGGVANTSTATVESVAGSTTNAVGSTVGSTTGTAGNLTGSLKGLQISQSSSASAEGGSTLSLGSGNLRLESGTTFNLLVSSSNSAGTPR